MTISSIGSFSLFGGNKEKKRKKQLSRYWNLPYSARCRYILSQNDCLFLLRGACLMLSWTPPFITPPFSQPLRLQRGTSMLHLPPLPSVLWFKWFYCTRHRRHPTALVQVAILCVLVSKSGADPCESGSGSKTLVKMSLKVKMLQIFSKIFKFYWRLCTNFGCDYFCCLSVKIILLWNFLWKIAQYIFNIFFFFLITSFYYYIH